MSCCLRGGCRRVGACRYRVGYCGVRCSTVCCIAARRGGRAGGSQGSHGAVGGSGVWGCSGRASLGQSRGSRSRGGGGRGGAVSDCTSEMGNRGCEGVCTIRSHGCDKG